MGTSSTQPLVAPRQMGVDPRIAAATALAPGGAGRRLAAKIIDGVLPAILYGVAAGIGASLIRVTQVGEFAQVDFSWLLILLGIASVLSLGYAIWLWLWEAKSGKTPGNLMVGLRTTNMEGHPAGVVAIFLRQLIIVVSSIVPIIGPVLVTISNTWDANEKKQGWHDKVANTLVFNIKAGRNPLETGGIAERADFVPAAVPTISEVRSPLARPAQGSQTQGGQWQGGQTQGGQWQGGQTQGGQWQGGQTQGGQNPGEAAPAAPPARGGRRKRKAAADPFAPAVVQFHGQQGQPGQPTPCQQEQTGRTAPAQTFPTQPMPDEQGQQGQHGRPGPAQPMQQGNPFAPPSSPQAGNPQAGNPQPLSPVDQGPITAVPGFSRAAQPAPAQPAHPQPQPHSQQFRQDQPPAGQPPAGQTYSQQQAPPIPQAAHDDDAAGETRIRPVGVQSVLRLNFDDGHFEDVGTVALIGRNPAGYDGEMISRLISVQDSSRSVSKTHLHVRIGAEGLWVTDRNSTNGSSLSDANGMETALVGGTPALAEIGSRVHFGDRSFVVGHP
ncbi:RDD family protein [Arthrobacter sp. H35-D1]|uniref:RDD family protein n=1 Tax=Arthrobacter sp. H35-D1 TaxID=3046202 RepID=UPI0024BBE122|nr:RDD family protein [Arthrobacter sp. H35-D1]MDJ0314380.1 RDD family protein [Arthrobacter sp. H35-D1]